MDRSPDARPGPRAPYELGPVLQQIAGTTARSLGFRTTVINLHRPAWDDFQTVVVHGSDEARRVLLGQSSSWEDWTPLLDARFERGGAYFIEHDAFDWSQDGLLSYVPEMSTLEGPDAWHPEDALFVPLRSAAGEMLGILAVDEPLDGRRPTDEQLDQLGAAASHAALALELAQQAAAATRQRAAVEHMLRVSTASQRARHRRRDARRGLRRRPGGARLREGLRLHALRRHAARPRRGRRPGRRRALGARRAALRGVRRAARAGATRPTASCC